MSDEFYADPGRVISRLERKIETLQSTTAALEDHLQSMQRQLQVLYTVSLNLVRLLLTCLAGIVVTALLVLIF